jgi:CBS domain-containing protein
MNRSSDERTVWSGAHGWYGSTATVEDIMTGDVSTVRPDLAVQAAARLMEERGIPGVAVVDACGRLVGVLSEDDLLARLAPRRRLPWWPLFYDSERLAREYQRTVGRTVDDVMMRPPITVTPDLPLGAVAELFATRRIGIIPVVREGHLLGAVSRRDLLAAVATGCPSDLPRSDAEIARDMQARMAREPWVATPGARVSANDGVVELSGLVASEAEKRALEAMARAIPGCRGVDSWLVTRDSLASPWRPVIRPRA